MPYKSPVVTNPRPSVRSPVFPAAAEGAGGLAISATKFDGTNDYISRSDFVGATNGKKGIFNIWLDLAGSTDGSLYSILSFGDGEAVVFDRPGTFDKLNFQLVATDASSVWNTTSSRTVIATDGWVNVLLSWDAALGLRHFYINDVSQAPTAISNKTINYAASPTTQYVGSQLSGGFKLPGCMSEVYFNQAEYLDLSVEANRRKFIDASGKPVNLGADGSIPTGTQPLLFLPNPFSTFEQNEGTGGDFTVTGVLEACGSSPSD